MNEAEFKRHLHDLVHGRHHVEEHEWSANPPSGAKPLRQAASKKNPAKRRRSSQRTGAKRENAGR